MLVLQLKLMPTFKRNGRPRYKVPAATHPCLGQIRFIAVGNRPRQLAERFLVLLIRDVCEISRELQAHTSPRTGSFGSLAIFKAFEKVRYRHAKNACDFAQSPCGDSVDSPLIFMGLLVGDADHVGHPLLT